MAITLLSAPPAALDQAALAEVSAATPATFEGIAPLLRYKDADCTVTCEPPFETFSGGTGHLYVTEEALSFFAPSSSMGISIPYPHITLHAISRAPMTSSSSEAIEGQNGSGTSQGGGPCIYCQVDEVVVEQSADEIEGVSREVMIVPQDSSSLDKLFEMISYCASLHPPPHADDPSALFGGLDPDSMVYADEDGNIVGPGANGHEDDDAWQDAAEEAEEDARGEQQSSDAGRAVRSDYVNNNRSQPY
ncbi:hypothetical protein OIV83_004612 [Microbotryomycetes sp. JL201]|nr:hypothetical protein OIV83_004612 [Microbotryomycetes sp. JL201]